MYRYFTVPTASSGFRAGKKVKGRKRLTVTDTLRLLLAVHVVATARSGRARGRPAGRPGAKPLVRPR
ncbi:hypothetical protein GCM10010495_65310 [Kitasatospora herbaricolor]|nr:hypothetical protein GCM10010495_65310 [Kitasatospora herbaricolor]